MSLTNPRQIIASELVSAFSRGTVPPENRVTRNPVREIVDILAKEKFNGKVLFHFFGEEDPEYALERLDAYFSFPPIKSAKREIALVKIPTERILAETDSPYVGKTPMDVEKSIMIIAEKKGMEYKEAAETTSRNAFKVFGLDAY